jgi:epsilon-lactone hydrolase
MKYRYVLFLIFLSALLTRTFDSKAYLFFAPRTSVDAEGSIHIPSTVVPLSNYMSPEAKRAFIAARNETGVRLTPDMTLDQQRAAVDEHVRSRLTHIESLYPVEIEKRSIAGVAVDVITPKAGIASDNRDRILINLHGASFAYSFRGLARLLEAIPIAGEARIQVLSIDYRTSPQYEYPAATEDVTAVYRELLKSYRPENIGIFGCSTGAALTANVVAWFQKVELPAPGAIGLFCEGAIQDDRLEGDSHFISRALSGRTTLPTSGKPTEPNEYMRETDPLDPIVAPIVSLDVLSRFPPVLLLTGTRDPLMSGVLYTHARLVKANVDADLHVWDGMWHAFMLDPDLPESREAYAVIRKFFDGHLGRLKQR